MQILMFKVFNRYKSNMASHTIYKIISISVHIKSVCACMHACVCVCVCGGGGGVPWCQDLQFVGFQG